MASEGKILIAGGGIGGLAAAIGLRQAGYDITVLERSDYPAQAGAALGINSSAMLAMRRLGAVEPVLEAGLPQDIYELVSWRGRRLARWSPGLVAQQLGIPSTTVPRHVVLDALRGALPPEAILINTTVTGYQADDDEVRVRLSDGSEVSAALLVAADGWRSVIRTQMLGLGSPQYAGYTAWRGAADATTDYLRERTARHYLGLGRTFGTWPRPGDRAYWAATVVCPPPEGTGAAPITEQDLAELRTTFADAPEPVRRLLEATSVSNVLRTPIYDRDPEPVWYEGRVVLLGDAAHAIQPSTGQGGCQALYDAVCLAHVLTDLDLSDLPAVTAALSAYQATRRPVATGIAAEARRMGVMHHATNPLGWRARNLVMLLTPGRVWQRRAERRLDHKVVPDESRSPVPSTA
jgi:2-polyprenyl-6-methoxyphenol hydroxylase-like FAD-dependent oxidoreductase